MVVLLWLALQSTDELIRQLGADDVNVRDAAQEKLAAMGEKVEPDLRKAAAHEDPEIRARVEALIRAIEVRRGGFLLYVVENEETGLQGLMRADCDGGNATVIAGGEDSFFDWFDFSPDGSKVAYADDGVLHVCDRDGTEEMKFGDADETGYVNHVRWAHDGKALTVETVKGQGTTGEKHPSMVVGLDGKVAAKIGDDDIAPTGSPDGKWIAFAHGEGERSGSGEAVEPYPMDLYVATSEGKERRCIAKVGKPVMNLTWSRDGSRIYYTYFNDDGQTVCSVGVDGKDERKDAQFSPAQEIMSMAWMPGGDRLLLGMLHGGEGLEDQERLVVLDVKSGKSERLGPEGLAAWGPAVSPDGKRVAFVSNTDLYMMDVDGKNPRKVVSGVAVQNVVRWGAPKK